MFPSCICIFKLTFGETPWASAKRTGAWIPARCKASTAAFNGWSEAASTWCLSKTSWDKHKVWMCGAIFYEKWGKPAKQCLVLKALTSGVESLPQQCQHGAQGLQPREVKDTRYRSVWCFLQVISSKTGQAWRQTAIDGWDSSAGRLTGSNAVKVSNRSLDEELGWWESERSLCVMPNYFQENGSDLFPSFEYGCQNPLNIHRK